MVLDLWDVSAGMKGVLAPAVLGPEPSPDQEEPAGDGLRVDLSVLSLLELALCIGLLG